MKSRKRERERLDLLVVAGTWWDEYDAALLAVTTEMVADDDVVATFDRVGWLAKKMEGLLAAPPTPVTRKKDNG